MGETGSGPETLKQLEGVKVDALVLDLTMPGMPGSRVAELALKCRPSLAIVVLTMHEDEYYLQELLRIGVHRYLV